MQRSALVVRPKAHINQLERLPLARLEDVRLYSECGRRARSSHLTLCLMSHHCIANAAKFASLLVGVPLLLAAMELITEIPRGGYSA